MQFEEVLPALREGKKAKRQKWKRYTSVSIIRNALEVRFAFATNTPREKDGNTPYTEIHGVIGIADLLADDWEIIEC